MKKQVIKRNIESKHTRLRAHIRTSPFKKSTTDSINELEIVETEEVTKKSRKKRTQPEVDTGIEEPTQNND